MTRIDDTKTDDTPTQVKEKPTVERAAYSIDEFGVRNNVGRTFTYGEIRSGRLKARKAGSRTLITASDERAWLESLPLAAAS